MIIWIDADSCPISVRNIVIKAATKNDIETFFVANHKIPIPKHKLLKMICTEATPDAADTYIVENCNVGDLVITRDIPMAKRVIEKNVVIINDRGTCYDKKNINERLSMRNFMLDLYNNGLMPEKTKTLSPKDIQAFSNCFDKELQKLLKSTKQ